MKHCRGNLIRLAIWAGSILALQVAPAQSSPAQPEQVLANAPGLLDAPCRSMAFARANQGQILGSASAPAVEQQGVAVESAPATDFPRIKPFQSPEQGKKSNPDDSSPATDQSKQTQPPSQAIAPRNTGDNDAPSEIYLNIIVPHRDRPTDSITAYPYPVKPPKLMQEVSSLPTGTKELKRMVLGSGYSNRWNKDQPYPPNGWRFQYAFETAVRRSGQSMPHTMIGMYPWANAVVPYLRPEIERANKAEEDRTARYQAAIDEYNKKYFDIQNEATRNGLFAINFRFYKKGQAYVRLPAGTWWLAGSRKVPGLYYYWQMPVTVAPGTKETVNLTEANALLIQGGW